MCSATTSRSPRPTPATERPKIAPGSVDKLLSAKADAIIGAASSSVSLSVIDKIINAGVVQFSPANTSTAFDTYDDKNLYFRTAPSDVLQGNVLGNLVLQDGAKNVAILARQEAYGEALADNVEKTIKDQGGNVAAKVLYSVDATSYTSEIQKIKDAKPDAIVLISFDEAKKLVPASSPPVSVRRMSRPTSSTATPPTTARTSRRARSRASSPRTPVRS